MYAVNKILKIEGSKKETRKKETLENKSKTK